MKTYKSLIDTIVEWDKENIEKFCAEVKKLVEEIDADCEEGEKEIRFMRGDFTAEDIIRG